MESWGVTGQLRSGGKGLVAEEGREGKTCLVEETHTEQKSDQLGDWKLSEIADGRFPYGKAQAAVQKAT